MGGPGLVLAAVIEQVSPELFFWQWVAILSLIVGLLYIGTFAVFLFKRDSDPDRVTREPDEQHLAFLRWLSIDADDAHGVDLVAWQKSPMGERSIDVEFRGMGMVR